MMVTSSNLQLKAAESRLTSADMQTDPTAFWTRISEANLLRDTVKILQTRLQACPTVFVANTAQRAQISSMLTSMTLNLGLSDHINALIERQRSEQQRERDSIANELLDLTRRAEESQRKMNEINRRSSLLANVSFDGSKRRREASPQHEPNDRNASQGSPPEPSQSEQHQPSLEADSCPAPVRTNRRRSLRARGGLRNTSSPRIDYTEADVSDGQETEEETFAPTIGVNLPSMRAMRALQMGGIERTNRQLVNAKHLVDSDEPAVFDITGDSVTTDFDGCLTDDTKTDLGDTLRGSTDYTETTQLKNARRSKHDKPPLRVFVDAAGYRYSCAQWVQQRSAVVYRCSRKSSSSRCPATLKTDADGTDVIEHPVRGHNHPPPPTIVHLGKGDLHPLAGSAEPGEDNCDGELMQGAAGEATNQQRRPISAGVLEACLFDEQRRSQEYEADGGAIDEDAPPLKAERM